MLNETYHKFVDEFFSGKLHESMEFFKENNYLLEYSYCLLLDEKLEQAYDIVSNMVDENTRARWVTFMIEAFNNKIVTLPSYFEIRNFLEIDINIFMKYKKIEFIKKLLSCSDYLSDFNLETYKYLGRVLWANDFIGGAMYFLERAKDYLYNDPELHYLLAYIYYEDYKDMKMSKKFISSCLEILPDYYPACALQKKISSDGTLC